LQARSPLAGGGTEISLHLFNYLERLSDRLFGTRLSVYGWALYFGNLPVAADTEVSSYVCIRCGSGAPSEWLRLVDAACPSLRPTSDPTQGYN
jgi:hypothetical protein